jgi:hypothetical protein
MTIHFSDVSSRALEKSESFEKIVTINETCPFHYDKETKDRLQFKQPNPRQGIALAYQHLCITELFISLLFILYSKTVKKHPVIKFCKGEITTFVERKPLFENYAMTCVIPSSDFSRGVSGK